MYNTYVEGASLFLDHKLEWYNSPIAMCVNLLLMPKWIKDTLQDVC